MNNLVKIVLGALLLSAVAGAGYWYGNTSAEFRVLSAEGRAERKLLYYRNPMGLPDTSPVPKKDSMGMDYVPVYAGEEQSASVVSIGTNKVQKLGVRSEAAAMRALERTLNVTGRVEIDERRIHTIAPRFEGWVERLQVNTTGQAVRKGEALFEVYSPELVAAQREHALAVQGLAALKDADEEAKQSMQRLVDAGATRLKNWNMAADTAAQGITFRAPANGIVIEKKAVQGMRFMPGEMLYQIADLSSVWIIAEVPEREIGQVHPGAAAQVTVDAWPERSFDGKVEFIYPTLNEATRTVQVRMQVANPGGLLKPAMYALARIAVGKGGKVLTVPDSAVIDSGTRQVVLVRLAEGRFEAREVKLGIRGGDHVEVLAGVAEGEAVVTSAQFLLDSESNLKAALGGMTDAPAEASVPANGNRQQAGSYKAGSVGHTATGVLEEIYVDGNVSITHGPIPSLKWPGMTMDFALANPSLAAKVKPGTPIEFEIVERGEGEWVVTRMIAKEAGDAEHDH